MSATRLFTKLVILTAVGGFTASCGDVARTGHAPIYLVIDSITASSGGSSSSSSQSNILQSDVQRDTCPASSPCPTVFSDSGVATFHLALKDIGSTVAPTSPTSNNQVTLNRYHVSYRRADGRNTPGVDVPYGFDGAATVTIPITATASVAFELVRHVAKGEAPLVQLVSNPTIITTIADVTFYGQDLVGNEIQATGSIQVDFGNFGDQ